ncbi:MAG: Lin0512 family protein [Roseovarius sp.]|uniref:Lin0512 family protein n=1 Tax=Roseovarius sp. TaxID=1486281 RepID=UPI001B54A8ED|nr:Lin0512 family protein [Roseovarius sp.]MBQ0750251.1 Lin0512 family protein [Roseovarius sp.]MBQ0810127.1 Lin0512 family protein [Roseovarius sp.]
MSAERFIIEMGMGNDLHGMDYQKAAVRAIEDAIRHSTIPMFLNTSLDHRDMEVRVTVGVQDPTRVDAEALKAGLPRGRATVEVVFGGQNVTDPGSGETLVIATAAVEAFFPSQVGKWVLGACSPRG